MTHRYHSRRALALLLALPLLPLAAQGGGNSKARELAPHIQSQLWPDRELTPPEQEFKDRIVMMRDTVIALRATIDRADRARRTRNTPAVLMSQTNALSRDCVRVGRNSAPLVEWSATLSTNDNQFGEPALKRFRSAIRAVDAAAARCQTETARLTGNRDGLDPDGVYRLLSELRPVLSEYDQAAIALAKTLKIRIDATDRS